jgi:RNA-binding protein PNO1
MVVTYAEPSTSTATKKKTRRKMSKKTKAGVPSTNRDQDEGMALEGGEDSAMDIASNTAPVSSADHNGDDDLMIETEPSTLDTTSAPAFEPLPASEQRSTLKSEIRRIPIPPHRMSPLQKDWVNIFGPLTELLGLQVRMNVPRKSVEIRVRSAPFT